MRCANCGSELEGKECPYCHPQNTDIKVLTPEEKRHFTGVTIDQDGQKASEDYRYQRPHQRVYVRHAGFSLPKTGFFFKLLLGAGLIALAMTALTTILFFAVIGCAVWFVWRLLR